MNKFTNENKADGELAVRLLSKKAQDGYKGSDGVAVYAYEATPGDAALSYAIKDTDGLFTRLTLSEVEDYFEALADAEEVI